MKLSIIVAMANNHAIGKNNRLLWHLPEDLAYFKRVQMGKPIIMGRKTFESIGYPLKGRLNIVLSRQTNWKHNGVKTAHTIVDALALAKVQSIVTNDEVMVIGGAEIYNSVLAKTDKLYLTRIDTHIDGSDAFFPQFDSLQWCEVSRKNFSTSKDKPYNYAFCILERI